MLGRLTALALAAALMATVAAEAAKRPRLRVEVKPQDGAILPLRLSCPQERKSCTGTASFRGRKEKDGRIYRLSAAPFSFSTLGGGKSKTIGFRLSKAARKTLDHAGGMTVRITVEVSYGKGPSGTLHRRAHLEP